MADETKVIVRDDKGRYAPGTGGGPGRPTIRAETAYLRVMTDECTIDEWRAITRKAVAQAIDKGDWRARDWLTKYLIGPAIKAIETQVTTTTDPDTGRKIEQLRTLIATMYGGTLPTDESES